MRLSFEYALNFLPHREVEITLEPRDSQDKIPYDGKRFAGQAEVFILGILLSIILLKTLQGPLWYINSTSWRNNGESSYEGIILASSNRTFKFLGHKRHTNWKTPHSKRRVRFALPSLLPNTAKHTQKFRHINGPNDKYGTCRNDGH